MLEHNTEIVLLLNPSHELCCQICSLRLWRQARQRSNTTKKWGNPVFTQLQGFTASQIVDFFAKDLIVLHIWVSWNLEAHFSLDVPTEWSSRASFLGTWRCGFPACSWLMTEEGMDCFPIPQKSLHIQRLASFNGKPCIFQGKLSLEGEYFSLHPVPAVHLGL